MSFWSKLGSIVAAPVTGAGALLGGGLIDKTFGRGGGQAATSSATSPSGPWAYPGEMPDYQSTLPTQGLYRPPGNGDSPWLSMANQKQDLMTGQAQEGAQQKASSDASTAMNRLAMTRGLSGGAQERIASEGANNASNLWAKIGSEGNLAKADLGVKDEEFNRQNQQLDYQAQMKDAQMRNEYNLGRYSTKAQAWGAGKTADAQAAALKNSGGLFGGGGFLGTGLWK